MPYSSATQGSSATPAKTFMEGGIHTAMTNVSSGFTYIEQVVSAPYTMRVYKSASAGNGVADLYLATIRASDADTVVRLALSETWDTSGKHLRQYAVQGVSQTFPLDSTGRIADTTGLLVTDLATDSGYYVRTVPVAAGGWSWWISVTAKRFIIGTRVAGADVSLYAGIVRNAPPSAVVTPNFFLGDLLRGGFTREPGITVATTTLGSALGSNGVIGSYPFYANTDDYLGATYACSPLVTGRAAGAVRGFLADALFRYALVPVSGDTVTVGSVVYNVFRNSDQPGFILLADKAI